MKKPTRRLTVTTGSVTGLLAAVVIMTMSSSAASTNLADTAGIASRHPAPTIAPPLPAGASAPAAPNAVVVPPAPASVPQREDAAVAAAQAAAAAAAANNSGSTGSAPKKTTGTSGGSSGGSSGGGAAAPAAPSDNYAEDADIANAVFNLMNSERAQNGLPALGRSGQLNSSSHGHNVAMANTGQFAHQVSGEAALGARISATGYHWTSAGENIAWGSYASVAFGESLESQMYNEPPNQPNHRANILSTSFHNAGCDVITDGSGKMWITMDFGS